MHKAPTCLVMQIKAPHLQIRVAVMHAPPRGRPVEERRQWWKEPVEVSQQHPTDIFLMDANARIYASAMELPLIGDSLPTSNIDENGKMLAEFVNMHTIHLYNTLVGDAECWTYTDGA
eukprot:6952119-Pyramimonas_sp.AAC.1